MNESGRRLMDVRRENEEKVELNVAKETEGKQ